MKSLIVFLTLILLSQVSFAGPNCTTEDKSKWQNQEEFKKNLEKDYKIKVFKVTKGNCYEIYGWDKNKNNERVEIYFNPITGKVMKENRG